MPFNAMFTLHRPCSIGLTPLPPVRKLKTTITYGITYGMRGSRHIQMCELLTLSQKKYYSNQLNNMEIGVPPRVYKIVDTLE